MHQSSDAAKVLDRGLHFLAVVHGSVNRLFGKIHNSQGGSAGQLIPVALGYHPWLFKRPPKAYWMNPENHSSAPAFLRQPPLCFQANRFQANPSHRSHYTADVFVVTRGDRTRYPHGAVATNRPAGRGEGPVLKGKDDINI